MRILQPANWKRPRGYSNGVAAKGNTVFISGRVGWNGREDFVFGDRAGRVRQALTNFVDLLAEANAKPTDIVRMTCFLIEKKKYLVSAKEIGAASREIIGRHYPAMT